jgi:hypothetical protein
MIVVKSIAGNPELYPGGIIKIYAAFFFSKS